MDPDRKPRRGPRQGEEGFVDYGECPGDIAGSREWHELQADRRNRGWKA